MPHSVVGGHICIHDVTIVLMYISSYTSHLKVVNKTYCLTICLTVLQGSPGNYGNGRIQGNQPGQPAGPGSYPGQPGGSGRWGQSPLPILLTQDPTQNRNGPRPTPTTTQRAPRGVFPPGRPGRRGSFLTSTTLQPRIREVSTRSPNTPGPGTPPPWPRPRPTPIVEPPLTRRNNTQGTSTGEFSLYQLLSLDYTMHFLACVGI